MRKPSSGFFDVSASSPRLALALVLSLLLHIALVLRIQALPASHQALHASLRVSLVDKTAIAAAAPELGGAPPVGTVSPQPVAPGGGGAAVAAEARRVPQAAPVDPVLDGGESATRKVAFFANAAMPVGLGVGDIAGVPGMADPAYIAADKLAPRPQLPAGFRVSYPESAKAARLRETVRIAVLIDQAGRVVMAAGLDETDANAPFIKAAVQALRQAQFQPGQAAGQVVNSKAIVVVRFSYE